MGSLGEIMNFGTLVSLFAVTLWVTLQSPLESTARETGSGQTADMQLGNPVMESELSDLFVEPGTSTLLDVYVRNVSPTLVRGFQTGISISRTTGDGSAYVPCPCPCPPASHSDGGVRVIESRNDFIFFGQPAIVSAVNCTTWKALCSKFSGGVEVGDDRAFLSEYLISISPDATPGSQFEIALLPPSNSLLVDANNNQIPFGIGPPSRLTVVALPNPPAVLIHLVAVSSPTQDEVLPTLPSTLHTVQQHDTYYVEVWGQTNDPHGLQSISVDMNFNPALTHAVSIAPTSEFSEFRSGVIENAQGRVRDLSGSHRLVSPPCADQVAFFPNWTNLATVEMVADALGSNSISPSTATTPFLGTSICGQLGDVNPANIDFNGIQFSVTQETPIPAVSEWGVLVFGLLTLTAGTIRVLVLSRSRRCE